VSHRFSTRSSFFLGMHAGRFILECSSCTSCIFIEFVAKAPPSSPQESFEVNLDDDDSKPRAKSLSLKSKMSKRSCLSVTLKHLLTNLLIQERAGRSLQWPIYITKQSAMLCHRNLRLLPSLKGELL